MHRVTPVNGLAYGENTPQKLLRCNALALRELTNDSDELLFHIGGNNREWHGTFIVPPPQPENYLAERRALTFRFTRRW